MNNNFKIYLLIFISTIYTSSIAQNLGVKAGLNLSKVQFSSSSAELKYLPGISLGVIKTKSIGKTLGLEIGLKLDQRGYKAVAESQNLSSKIKLNLFYATVPILLKKYIGKNDNKPFLQIGADIGGALFGNVKSEVTVDGKTSKESEKVDFEDEKISRLDFGLNGGFGYKINTMEIGLNYFLGLYPLNKEGINSGAYNRTISINVAHFF